MKRKKNSVEEHIARIVKPIFEKVAQETHPNPMGVVTRKVTKAVQPHNYRLYFDYDRGGYNPTEPYSEKNHRSEHHYLFSTHRIVVRKISIEIQYLGHKKQWRKIEADSEKGISERLIELDVQFEEHCFNYLKDFINKNGGYSNFKVLRKRKQDWGIHGIEFLDNIPDDMIIHDTVFKKVYREKVEFHTVNEVKNVLTNEALRQYSPEIAQGLDKLYGAVNGMGSLLSELREVTVVEIHNKKLHLGVLTDIKTTLKQMRDKLPQKETTLKTSKKPNLNDTKKIISSLMY